MALIGLITTRIIQHTIPIVGIQRIAIIHAGMTAAMVVGIRTTIAVIHRDGMSVSGWGGDSIHTTVIIHTTTTIRGGIITLHRTTMVVTMSGMITITMIITRMDTEGGETITMIMVSHTEQTTMGERGSMLTMK